jgi:hypothetical protein
MRYMNPSSHRMSTGVLITIILLAVFTVAFAGLSAWAFLNYMDQKDNVDEKVERAVATAEKEQADKLEAQFVEREKEPLASFSGPSDYGTLSFKYPKTWDVYVEDDGTSSSGYLAYLNPGIVPSTKSNDSRYALRATVVNQSYDEVVSAFESRVEDGELKTSIVKAKNGQSGTRLDGTFSDDLRGAAVIFKIRDKTAVVRTDANTFKADFDKLVATIDFVQ